MHFSLGSTSSELVYPESLGCSGMNLMRPKPFTKVGDYTKKDNVILPYHEAKKMVVTSHVMSGHLEGAFAGKKKLEGPKRKLEHVRTLLIDNYDSYTYNIYQELSVINGVPPVVVRNDEWTWEEAYHYLYEEGAFDNIVISPGPGSPTCPSDVGICLSLLLECHEVPILGICLGHQALGYAHGAHIIHAPEPVHGRLSGIEHNGCRLFLDIPSGRNSGFKVVRYHSLVVDEETLPKDLIPIAWTSTTDTGSFLESQNHKYNGIPQRRDILMGIMHSTRPHFGLQFHPESIATCYGRQIFKNFRNITEDYWLKTKSSSIQERNINYTAHMQVPGSIRELPRSWHMINGSRDQLHQGNTEIGRSLFGLDDLSCTRVAKKFLKLKWRKFDQLANKVGGAKNIFSELFGARGAENTFWLDSSSTDKGRARFSFMGGKGGSLWKHVTFRLSDQSNVTSNRGGHLSVEDANGSVESKFLKEGFLEFLNKELSLFCYEKKDYEGLPFDFHGGYVGYLGYDLKVECGASSNNHKSSTPDACLFFADNLLVVDHCNADVYILSIHEDCMASTPWLDATEEKLIKLKASTSMGLKEQPLYAASPSSREIAFQADESRDQYIRDVKSCLEYIRDGESYELCLTTQLRRKLEELDPLGLYLHLREKNPAPYAAFLNFSNEGLCLCCSSPERFLRLDGNGILEAKPIKGTVARGSTAEQDEQFKLQLKYSEKDQAENLMIVDLLRNDLGRVCIPGSVHVPNLMDIESYATVHTMVSTIRGQKQQSLSAVECVRAAFPGGSMTGAPKLRSMELLDSLENCSRGIYSGSIGFFSYNGTFDLNIVIRTIVIHEGEASIGAGGAIVALSKPEDEYEEMILKTRAPSKAVMEFSSKN